VISTAIHRYHNYHVIAQPKDHDRFGTNKYIIWAPVPHKGGPAGTGC